MESDDDSPFELQAKAEEWMDVTPKEEILRAELDRLKDAFEKCSSQLDASRLENSLLKDSEASLQVETQILQDSLEATNLELQQNKNELKSAKVSTQDQISVLETKLDEERKAVNAANDLIHTLKAELSNTKQEQETAIARYKVETERLERELKSAKTDSNSHRGMAVKFAEDLRTSRDTSADLRRDLAETKHKLKETNFALKEAKTTTGTIATLAEDLKVQKHGLEVALKQAHQDGSTAEKNVHELKKEIVILRDRMKELERHHAERSASFQEELNDRRKDLDASGRSIELSQIEVKDAERTILKLSSERDELRLHLSSLEKGRHDLLDQKSELEESFEQIHYDLEAAQEKLQSTQALLEKTITERDALRLSQDELKLQSKGKSSREVDLECRLYDQRRLFESRLKDLHSILGLKFTTAVQSEIIEIQKSAIEQMRSPRIPTLRTPTLQSVKTT